MMKMRRAALALAALLIPGCGREPSLQWVLEGRVEVSAAEQEALRTVFADSKASRVHLAQAGGLLGGNDGRGLAVEGGRVVALATRGEVSPEALGVFQNLRRLVLVRHGQVNIEALGPWPRLEELRLDGSSLASLEGIGTSCPGLRDLSISHGPIQDLSPLADLPSLKTLRLEDHALANLTSAPPLAVTELVLTGGPLESLAGIEAFAGLEKLLLFGAQELSSLASLPSLPRLRELELFQNGLASLTGLAPMPALERIETSDNRILRAQLGPRPWTLEIEPGQETGSRARSGARYEAGADDEPDFPALRELEMHEKDLLSVELGPLPSLETVNLEGEGYLFKDGGRLHRFVMAPQPSLQRLDLRNNRLEALPGLAPQPALKSVQVDSNPFGDLEHFQQGYPALSSVSIRRTRVREIPETLRDAGIVVSHEPSEIEANRWEGILRDAFEARKDSFVEALPPLGGTARGSKARCSLKTSTFSTPRLSCTGSIQALEGLVLLKLVEVDPLNPAGGPSSFPIRATIRTRSGRARIYLKYELDLRGDAEALAGYRDPEAPIFQLGERHGPEDVKKGYSFAEARPGEPSSTSGEAHLFVDQLVVWVEGSDGAEGIEYVIEAPYR